MPITIEWLWPHIKKANDLGAHILCSGDGGGIEWAGGHKATIYECPGGVIVVFDKKVVTTCTENQLSYVLAILAQELIEPGYR